MPKKIEFEDVPKPAKRKVGRPKKFASEVHVKVDAATEEAIQKLMESGQERSDAVRALLAEGVKHLH